MSEYGNYLGILLRNIIPLAMIGGGLAMVIIALKTPNKDDNGNDHKTDKIVFSVIGFLLLLLGLFVLYKANN